FLRRGELRQTGSEGCRGCLFRKKSENGSLLRSDAGAGRPSRASNLPEGGLCCAPVRRTVNPGKKRRPGFMPALFSADTASSFDESSKENLSKYRGSNFCGSTGGSKPRGRFEAATS